MSRAYLVHTPDEWPEFPPSKCLSPDGVGPLTVKSSRERLTTIAKCRGAVTPQGVTDHEGGGCGQVAAVCELSITATEGGARRCGTSGRVRGGKRSGAGRHIAEHPRSSVHQIRWTVEEWENVLVQAGECGTKPAYYIREAVEFYTQYQKAKGGQ